MIWVPHFVGLLFGSIVSLPIVSGLRLSTKIPFTLLLYLEAIEGFGAVVAAALLFRLLGLPLRVPVFIIMATQITLYFVRYMQSYRALFKLYCMLITYDGTTRMWLRAFFSYLAGMSIGWFVVPKIF